MTHPAYALVVAILCLDFLTPTGAEDAPIIRFRGPNGSGIFPDCQPVTSWSEYQYEERKQGRIKWDEPVSEAKSNIVWKTTLPMWGNGQPIAVGGKLYLMHELPYWEDQGLGPSLVCLDPADGTIAWSKEIHHLDLLPASERDEVTEVWLADRRWVAAKWRLAWRMHQVDPGDQATIDQIWQDAVALGVTDVEDKRFGQKLGGHQMGDTGRFWKGQPKDVSQRVKALKDYNLWHPAWSEMNAYTPGRWMGVTFPTPVSDGRHIYIRTARHLLACCDLEGNIQWKTLYTTAKGYCDFAPSPIIVGDTLILYSSASRNSDEVICRGFDPQNGDIRWQIPGSAAAYALGTPVQVTLDSGRVVVFLPSGQIIDPGDGKILCKVPCHLAAGDNPVARGDIIYMRNSQSGGGYDGDKKDVPKGLQAVRISEEDGTVKQEVLWRVESGDGARGFGSGLVCTDDLLFTAADRGVTVMDPHTGEIFNWTRTRGDSWNISQAGDYLFVGDNQDATINVLQADRQLNTITEQQIGHPRKIPKDMWHYRNEKNNWGVVGKPFPMFFSGNRIFLRTWFDIYCIGDPQQGMALSPRHR